MSLFKKLKKFYFRSEENRMQFFELLGFIVLPVILMAVLFVVMFIFLR